jgi:Icc-related predicted phosphoesterase
MRLYYASDVHGSEKLWRKFLNTPSFYGARVLVMGGDLTGKVMVPLVEQRPGVWRARVLGKDREARGEERAAELERRIRLNGFYPVRCKEEEYRRLQEDDSYQNSVFRDLMRSELMRWMKLAHDKLAGTDVRCFIMPGNDDEPEIDDVLENAPEPVESVDGRVTRFDGLQMASSAWANPTPWDSPRELREEELLERLESIMDQLDEDVPAIFNLHCPPRDSGLDRAPELTEDLRVVTEGGEPKIVSVGSTAVRTVIERHQPLLGLHGHIHESRGTARIGRTICINPGSAYAEGVLDGAIVELEGGRVVSHQFVSG